MILKWSFHESWCVEYALDCKPQFFRNLFMYLFIFLRSMKTLPLSERLAPPVLYPLYGSAEQEQSPWIQIG